MCILNAEGSSVNSGSRQLFDVVGVDSRGRFRLSVGNSLTLDVATARAAGFNARPSDMTAVVLPSGTLVDILSLDEAGEVFCVMNPSVELDIAQKLAEEYAEDCPVALAPAGKETETPTKPTARESAEAEASNSPVDASSEGDGSDVTEGIADAAGGNLANDFDADAEPTYRIVIMQGNGDVKLLPGRFTYDDAQQWQEAFDQPTYLAEELPVPVGAGEIGNRRESRDNNIISTCQPSSRASFVQSAVRSHLEVIGKALPYVNDAGDIGLLAMSLREVAKMVDGIGASIEEVPDLWGFDCAMDSEGWDNDDLKAALGLESEVAV